MDCSMEEIHGEKSINASSVTPSTVSWDVNFQSLTFSRRWWILIIFGLSAATQGILWNTFSPISYALKVSYGWSDGFIAIVPGVSNFGFIISAFPIMYIAETRGLRVAMIICVTLLMFCSSFWLIGVALTENWMVLLGSPLNGIAAAIFMAAPPLLSVLWFPVGERTTATSLGSAAGALGNGIPFISGPYLSGANITAADLSKNFTEGYISTVKNGVMNVLYFNAGLSLACFIGVIFYFPDKPPKPPSRSANLQRVEFRTGFKSLFKNGTFWLLNIAYNLPNAIFNSWLPLISISFETLGVTEVTAGWLGFVALMTGAVSSICISLCADHFKRRTKLFLVSMTCGQITCFVILICIQQKYFEMPASALQPSLYAICVLAGAFFNGMTPLCYEMACECAYPVHEGLTNEVICVTNNFIGMIFFLIFLLPSLMTSTLWMTWLCLGSSVVSLPLLLLLKGSYKRLDIDNQD